MGGVAIAVLGIWVLCQVIGGDALGRLGLVESKGDGLPDLDSGPMPPGDDPGGNGGGAPGGGGSF